MPRQPFGGHYVGDLTFAGVLDMAVLRSPHAHARIVSTAGRWHRSACA